jgi:hypothetical protein
MAEQAGDLIHNRPLAQHQTTILAVSATIDATPVIISCKESFHRLCDLSTFTG